MQHLENDMDALFQQAAEHYQLNPGKDEWQTVLGKMKKQQGNRLPAEQTDNRQRGRLLIIAALLFMAASIFFFAAVTMQRQKKAEDTAVKNLILLAEKSQHADKAKKQMGKSNLLTPEDKKDIHLPGSKTKPGVKNKVVDYRWSAIITKAVTGNTSEEITKVDETKINDENGVQQLPVKPAKLLYEKKNTTSTILLPITLAFKGGNRNIERANKNLYLGIATGFDFNKGASMNYSNTGWKAGALVGYQVNDAIAVESGVSWLSKTYESHGKDFNMEKIASSMPPGMIINKLKTHSTLIEIPISIKYDFYGSGKNRLFVNAGISSYIMLKEMNEYNVTLNGQQDKLTGMYKQKNWVMPAVASLSFGYQQQITRQSRLRIEPYIKIPLKGIGIGSLPVTTAGLQLAITSYLK